MVWRNWRERRRPEKGRRRNDKRPVFHTSGSASIVLQVLVENAEEISDPCTEASVSTLYLVDSLLGRGPCPGSSVSAHCRNLSTSSNYPIHPEYGRSLAIYFGVSHVNIMLWRSLKNESRRLCTLTWQWFPLTQQYSTKASRDGSERPQFSLRAARLLSWQISSKALD